MAAAANITYINISMPFIYLFQMPDDSICKFSKLM